jgi:ATP synthase protein I
MATKATPPSNGLRRAVESQAPRKLKAKRQGDRSLWFGFGTFGMIGWSIAIPTLLGAALGHWIDRHFPSGHSWTLELLIAGLIAGCAQAWHWVSKEEKSMRKERDDHE